MKTKTLQAFKKFLLSSNMCFLETPVERVPPQNTTKFDSNGKSPLK